MITTPKFDLGKLAHQAVIDAGRNNWAKSDGLVVDSSDDGSIAKICEHHYADKKEIARVLAWEQGMVIFNYTSLKDQRVRDAVASLLQGSGARRFRGDEYWELKNDEASIVNSLKLYLKAESALRKAEKEHEARIKQIIEYVT